MAITAETYTRANGSNMDRIEYKDGVTVEQVAEDLRKSYDDWDYVVLTEGGEVIATVER